MAIFKSNCTNFTFTTENICRFDYFCTSYYIKLFWLSFPVPFFFFNLISNERYGTINNLNFFFIWQSNRLLALGPATISLLDRKTRTLAKSQSTNDLMQVVIILITYLLILPLLRDTGWRRWCPGRLCWRYCSLHRLRQRFKLHLPITNGSTI